MIKVVYVTSSKFKRDENRAFSRVAKLSDGSPVASAFQFEFRPVAITEMLEVDLRLLVANEVTKAYQQIRVPCIVEHAGLIFEDYADKSYPGGLTKAMWNALGDRFVSETHSENRRACARAVVAYCDGMTVRTFVGDTEGTIAPAPRGRREFYWDTIFVPDTDETLAKGRTFSEIVEDAALGLDFKMAGLSQSARAMLKFLEYLRVAAPIPLWA
jgi:XTP/dITP diphosphohydrolase